MKKLIEEMIEDYTDRLDELGDTERIMLKGVISDLKNVWSRIFEVGAINKYKPLDLNKHVLYPEDVKTTADIEWSAFLVDRNYSDPLPIPHTKCGCKQCKGKK